jgi:glucose/arabinose dehydrogenase
MRVAILIGTAALASCMAGCKDKGGAGERPSVPAPAAVDSRPTAPGAPAGTAPADPPPAGTDELAPVPADVVAHVALVEVIHGLKRPVAAVAAPGDSRKRLFVVEQHKGRIVVIENGAKAKTPFLDLGDAAVSQGEEQGLLGLAFHPQFATNHKLYVDYTNPDGNTRVVEYQAGADAVDPATARQVFAIDQPYSNHNGGNLVFGPDGQLYVGLGDGGSAGDPHGAGQDLDNLLAKMLRIDVDKPDAKPEIVHYGLRNPWRYTFDAKTGDLYIGDVGQDKWENVYVVAAGDHARKNFGWNVAEGRHCFKRAECDRSAFTAPIADYPHSQGCSVTGGVVYRGAALPALDGVYFYADYCTALVRSFRWYADPSAAAGGVAREHWDWRAALDPDAKLQSISSFGTDADGELLIVTLPGAIYRLAAK